MNHHKTNRYRSTALKGVKILELAWVIAGPLTSKYFADNGATVIRIESKKRPDMLRTSEPFKDGKPGINRAGIFAFYGTNKYSMALDFKHAQAMQVLRRLVSWADIVTENFAPGKIEELGLGYDVLRQIKPDIIMARIIKLNKRYARYDSQTQPVGLGKPATLHAPLAGPLGNN